MFRILLFLILIVIVDNFKSEPKKYLIMIICFNVEKRFPWFAGDIEESYILGRQKLI